MSVDGRSGTPTHELVGLRWRPAWISRLGCIKACAEQLGVEVGLPWLYGLSGYAFLLNIHRELCPSGWHVADPPVDAMLARAGLALEPLAGPAMGNEVTEALQRQAWDGTRAALDAGTPCFGYDFVVGDFYTIHGYDDVGYYFSGPLRDEGAGPKPWNELGSVGHVGVVWIYQVRAGQADADTAAMVRDALAWAVNHGRTPAGDAPVYASGLAGYDLWRNALSGDLGDGHGAAYNAVCYAECRSRAVEFLREARRRLGDAAPAALDEAAEAYGLVARQLGAVAEAIPFFGERAAALADPARLELAMDELGAAHEAEARGLEALARAAAALEG